MKKNTSDKKEEVKPALAEEHPNSDTASSQENQKEIKKKNIKSEIIRILKFLAFSCTAGIIQIGSFTLLNEVAGLIYWPSYLISLVLSVVYNFTINRKFTFKSASNVPIAMLMVAGYYLVFTPLSLLWGVALTDHAGWNEYIVEGLTMVINFVTEFLFTRYVVFRKSLNTQPVKVKNDKEVKNKNDKPKQ